MTKQTCVGKNKKTNNEMKREKTKYKENRCENKENRTHNEEKIKSKKIGKKRTE